MNNLLLRNPTFQRSALAVAAGFLLTGALAFACDSLLRTARPHLFPRIGQPSIAGLLDILAYTVLAGVGGAALTAWLAPRRPMLHALILGGIGTVLALFAQIALWSLLPAWYHLAAVLLILPAAAMGALLVPSRGRRT